MRILVAALVCLVGCGSLPDNTPGADGAVNAADGAVNAGDGASVLPPGADGGEPAALWGEVRQILRTSCSGYCHQGGSNIGASLVLAPEDGSAPALSRRVSRQVSGRAIVVPGDPDASYLVNKIEGTMHALPECAADARRCGTPMPYAVVDGQVAVVMPEEQRAVIRRWIAAGAAEPPLPE